MSNEAKNSLKGAHHRSRISCNRPRSTPRRAEVSSADGDRSLSSPLACYDRCGRGGATLRRCSRRQGRAAGCKWTPSRHQWQPWSAELQCVGVRSRSQTRIAVPDACATPKGDHWVAPVQGARVQRFSRTTISRPHRCGNDAVTHLCHFAMTFPVSNNCRARCQHTAS